MSELSGFHFIVGGIEASLPPLVLLHGSSGRETDLIPFAGEAAPQRCYVALRGGIEWEAGFAFFRRNADRSLDYSDLADQTDLLCQFIGSAMVTGVLRQPPILMGFSNGAIMAASILRRQPSPASGAILMRPLSPAPAGAFPHMTGMPILITAGELDQRRDPDDAILVKKQFEASGATVSAYTLPTDHGLHRNEASIVADWLARKES